MCVPSVFYGSEELGLRADKLKTQVAVAAWEWGAYLGDEGLEKGIRIKTSSYTRHHVNIAMCKAKANGQYINSILALQEALDDGYDEALLLDTEGYVGGRQRRECLYRSRWHALHAGPDLGPGRGDPGHHPWSLPKSSAWR